MSIPGHVEVLIIDSGSFGVEVAGDPSSPCSSHHSSIRQIHE
ncbi:MAG: hypothetical protein QGF79_00955 [Arenicellales bacterium]|nr:hypothetical protein [Arenicellales bacterium]MDP6551974.1 hypothetical protein [Arenicellales bacterium]MDP6919133.1 hypothetical protein [Arenicellales bacterium]